jgi:hypothetical protein
MHSANVCRLLKKIEAFFAKIITITRDRSMTPENILKILVNLTEQQISVSYRFATNSSKRRV